MLSVPAQSLRSSLAAWEPCIGPDIVFMSLMKGIERDTGKRASENIAEVTGIPADRVAVLSALPPGRSRHLPRGATGRGVQAS